MSPVRERSQKGEGASAAAAVAVREAARFDRGALSLRAGLVAAIPVAAVLAAGTLAGDRVAAVTMGAGALLVGVAWRGGGGRPPLATMVTTTGLMGLSTFAGAVSGNIAWLHYILLSLWGLGAGLIVAVGRRSAVIGLQAIIAIVVFGRFPQPIPQAAGLALLVMIGGATQVVFSALVGAPPAALRYRTAVAEAYRRLAVLAGAPRDSAAAAAAALDEAEKLLTSPSLLGDGAMMSLASLVDEGRRIRLELIALGLLLRQYERRSGAPDVVAARLRAPVRRVQDGLQRVLRSIAATAQSEDEAAALRLGTDAAALTAAIDALTEAGALQMPALQMEPVVQRAVEAHAVALAGQVRAAVGLVAATSGEHRRLTLRPSLGSRGVRARISADLDQIRANASLQSAAGRHALRLAVVVPSAALIASYLPISRGYWIVVAAAAVLRPEFGATFTRATERVAGTIAGAVLAGLLVVALHPSGWATVALVGLLAWGTYTVLPASFAAGTIFLTAVIVFLLNAVTPDTLGVAMSRGLDTVIGGAIGLLVFVAWPTWSRGPARQALADLAEAQRPYVHAVLGSLVDGAPTPEEDLRRLGRRARLAWTNASATVARSLTEPATRRIDAHQSNGLLTSLRRLIQATHVARLEAQAQEDPMPLPALRPLAAAIDAALDTFGAELAPGGGAGVPIFGPAPTPAPGPRGAVPPLRELYAQLASDNGNGARRPDPLLLVQLDEMVDATNTAAELLGLRTGVSPE